MRNLKKILALVLALVMSFSLMATANAFTDSDKINGTYNEAVDVLSALKVFQGYENGSFVPQGSITRAEVAAIIYRIVTGDVDDKQDGIYADYNKFNDVKSTSWYAGYVNFCANAEYIKGYDAKTFGPNDPVTGYQALAMILRAVGYDKNGEFTGSNWQVQTAAVGKKLGITNNVTEGTLGTAASREVVAELLFQTIAKAKQVEYTIAYGYQAKGDTLGYDTFGLRSAEGIVTANQATGASATVVSKDYAGTTPVAYGYESGLDLIGHSVKVWYNAKDAKNAAYVVLDKSTAETVLTTAEVAAKVNAKTVYSDNYGAFNRTNYTPGASKYVVIDGGKAVISVNQVVERIFAINNYAVVPTMTTTQNTTGPVTAVYKQSELTGFDKDTMAVNDFVIVTQIAGQRIFNIQKVEKTITGIVRFSDSLGNVTLTDGTVLSRSSANMYRTADLAGMPQEPFFSTLETYVFTLDADGRYIGSQEVSGGYLFGTYGYYMIDDAATARMSYYVTGVDMTGSVVTKQIDANTYNAVLRGNIPTLDTATQGINTPANGAGRDYALSPTITEGVLSGVNYIGNGAPTAVNVPGTQYVGNVTRNQDVVIRANTIAFGTGNAYFVDNNTKFVFISGTAAQPVTEIKTGITELLGGGDSYVIPGGANESVMAYSVLNYTVNAPANFHVDTIVVKAPYAANSAADLYYLSETDKADANVDGRADYVTTTTTTLGTIPSTLIGIHKNSKALIFDTFVATNAVNGITRGGAEFYTHAVDANGVVTLTEVPQTTAANINNPIHAYYNAHIRAAGTSGLYITNNNGALANRIAENAVVMDLRPNQVSQGDARNGFVGTSQLAEITDINTLITKAAEYDFVVDTAGTAAGMTIVYIKSAQIRALSYPVVFEVKQDGVAVGNPTNFYNILTGIGQSGQVVPFDGTVDFQLQNAPAGTVVSYTFTGVANDPAKVVNVQPNKWINGQWFEGVYTVSNITAPITITITLPNATLAGAVTSVVNAANSGNVMAAGVTGYKSFEAALANISALNVGAAEDIAVTVKTDATGMTYANFAGSVTPTEATFTANAKAAGGWVGKTTTLNITGANDELNLQNGDILVLCVTGDAELNPAYVAFRVVK